jgi:hypothetical protein
VYTPNSLGFKFFDLAETPNPVSVNIVLAYCRRRKFLRPQLDKAKVPT